MVSRRARRAVVALAAVAAFGAAACGEGTPTVDAGDVTGEPGEVTPGDAVGAPIPGGGLTVTEAMESDLDGPLTVGGFLIEAEGEVRLCETALESFPPQCGEPSLRVEGVDVAEMDGAEGHEGVTWVEDASLTGEVADGVLTVSPTTA